MTEHTAKILKGRVIIALNEELGRKPTNEEIEQSYRTARVLYATMNPTFFERHKLKQAPSTAAHFK